MAPRPDSLRERVGEHFADGSGVYAGVASDLPLREATLQYYSPNVLPLYHVAIHVERAAQLNRIASMRPALWVTALRLYESPAGPFRADDLGSQLRRAPWFHWL